jgi:hypothetical protein
VRFPRRGKLIRSQLGSDAVHACCRLDVTRTTSEPQVCAPQLGDHRQVISVERCRICGVS